MAAIGIIGGSGLYAMDEVKLIRSVSMDTPFGLPSDELVVGRMGDREVVFLARHGRGHRLLPTEVNARANIYALKTLGVNWIISVSAVGSLKPELRPMDFVIVDQFYDRTNQARGCTFFGDGIVAHISFAHPVCPQLGGVLQQAARAVGVTAHVGGTYVNMEGPAFSTLAESQIHRQLGMSVVGMTQMNEARLAREAEICYATLAMVTDYDCWHEEIDQNVSVELILDNLHKSVANARALVKHAVAHIDLSCDCSCHHALQNAIVTDKKIWPEKTVDKLRPILQNYL
ncbi:MAG TPA: S-methyl-5'-thioadenosine phosphorylase [bacterium]|nr:S-methyl-5'-thioadenosine phosphorylase [bacterium]HPG45003.1 S-methyl-5'-thioadenosine phosphorylase [bacterium]HPM97245.1 S-methyl-5'-thioadenosine phosphorylase [bacterium]